MSLALTNRVAILRDRAEMLGRSRAFFAEKKVLEEDVPILSERASIDTHTDLIQACCTGKRAFLHSSPEYGMKRLLAEGIGDIYQMSHVFRGDECGTRHNPEFMMVEWYRHGFTFQEMIEETIAFFHLFVETDVEFEMYSYKELFDKYVGHFPTNLEERDHLFAFEIEPHLRQTIIQGFPADQAALSQIHEGVAERFELFYQGVELANGYHELTDPAEQLRRFERENRKRIALHKESYPLDTHFLAALEKGIPDCCGVAVGFDRLMMLRHGVETIEEVIPFSWSVS